MGDVSPLMVSAKARSTAVTLIPVTKVSVNLYDLRNAALNLNAKVELSVEQRLAAPPKQAVWAPMGPAEYLNAIVRAN